MNDTKSHRTTAVVAIAAAVVLLMVVFPYLFRLWISGTTKNKTRGDVDEKFVYTTPYDPYMDTPHDVYSYKLAVNPNSDALYQTQFVSGNPPPAPASWVLHKEYMDVLEAEMRRKNRSGRRP